MPEKKRKTPAESYDAPDDAATPSVSDPFIGKTFGHCEIIEKISEGGSAYVYRGYNVRFDLDRVIKILKPSLTEEEDFYFRFRQEAQLTARLDHPNILRVFDTGEQDGYFYIEMEYIRGQTLREYIQMNPKLNEREILEITTQVARALDYAHNVEITAPNNEVIHGILHRDLKPENVMLTQGKLVKLMDFGAAKPLNITSNTMQGMIVGTFHYMSPEQLKGEDLDARSDFFSLGIIMYELCTGVKPFAAENLTELIDKITTCKYAKLRSVRPTVTVLTEELIDRLLSKKRDHRPKTTKEIEEIIQISAQRLTAWSEGRRVRVPFSFKRAFPAISALFSTLALALSIYSAFFKSGTPTNATLSSAMKNSGSALSGSTLLGKGKELERRRLWGEAVQVYESVPTVDEGGLANEYLEAQIRLAYISFTYRNQLTKARSILEKLRMEYSDPAIDAYLGKIYMRQSLHIEAKERFETALSSTKGSVIQITDEFKSDLLFDLATSLDKQYIYVDKDPGVLMEAIKAWSYFIEFAGCDSKKSKNCIYAKKRIEELHKIDEQLNRGK
ncbi:MAG: protein kinase [Chitinivibrionales bacterium]|nr:protein kinase [Chitinivibrionales bacterium]